MDLPEDPAGSRPREAARVGARRWLKRRPLLACATRRPVFACAMLCALWFGLLAGLRPLAVPDEGRYVGIAWEMLRDGQWLVPTLNGAPFFHKPPLFYWLTGASMAIFGTGPWAARLPAVLATTVAATALFAFLRSVHGDRRAWTTVTVLATMPLAYGSAQYANLDPLVAACITLAILCAAGATLRQEAGAPFRGWCAGACTAVALGVLAKGLIGIVLPALVIFVWALARRRLLHTLRLWLWAPGWAIFLLIAAPWFVAMQWRFPGFAHYFFVVQHFDRYTGGSFNNVQPIWFYPALLAVGAAPWSPWLWMRVRRRPVDRHSLAMPAAPALLMLVWGAVVLLFFSLPQAKPIGYILPALPPLAWAIAGALDAARGPTAWRHPALLSATAALAVAICVGTVSVLHFRQPKSQAALATRLEQLRRHGEPVIYIDNYYFDLAVSAHLEAPVRIADDWAAADIARDSWRRELVDAERFLPADAPTHRVPADRLAALVAGEPSAWIVGPVSAVRRHPWLGARGPVFEREGTALWHVGAPDVAPTSPDCARSAI